MFLGACAPGPQVSLATQEMHLPTDAELARNPELGRQWGDRLINNDPKLREKTEATLLHAGADSLPVLKRLARSRDQKLRLAAFGIIRQIGPPAIPLVIELLREARPAVRYDAVGILIDL